ncbi:MAG TPA: NAD(P)/FAD-dependent oxidoreductase [Steroidobacteraceae bacterium]
MSRRRHAEIAGAGLGGLTLAAALAQRGWSVRVHERAPQLRDLGVGTSIWENGHRAMAAVGALDEVLSYGSHIVRAEIVDHHLRPVRVTVYNDTDNRALVILRVDHHRALVNAARRAGVEIVTASPAKGADPDGTLILESGERLRADLVVGCDGYHSKVRDSLGLGDEVGFITEAWTGRMIVPHKEKPEYEINQNFWSGHRRVGVLSCRDIDYMYVCAPENCPHNPEEVRSKSINKALWIEAFPHLKDKLERVESEVVWNRYCIAHCRSWSAGRAAIVGDSANAMPPLLAQGAGCAMSNAVALAEALKDDVDIPSALVAWELRERPVTDITQRWAVLLLMLAKRWPLELIDMRSAMMAEGFSSPGLLAHFLSATRHVAKTDGHVHDLADSAA